MSVLKYFVPEADKLFITEKNLKDIEANPAVDQVQNLVDEIRRLRSMVHPFKLALKHSNAKIKVIPGP